MLDLGNTFYLISLSILITCLQENMDIIARNEIYITSGSWRLIEGITEEPTRCATAVLSFFPAKHFISTSLHGRHSAYVPKLAKAEIKQYSSL